MTNAPTMIRLLPLMLLALGLPIAAQAIDAKWTVLHEDAGGGDYVDLASVQRTGGAVEAWLLTDYVQPRSIRGVRRSQSNSALVKVRIDCAARASGLLELELRADRYGEGDVVFQHAVETVVMERVETDPTMLRAVEVLCGPASPAEPQSPVRTE
jgi:outer membrane receptor protein involved in Fe transport